MKNTVSRLLCMLLAVSLAFTATGCFNSDAKQQKIMNVFSGFSSSEQFILATRDEMEHNEIRLGSRVINIDDLTYDGERCFFILTQADGFYAYADVPNTESSYNILFFDYETMNASLLKTVDIPGGFTRTDYDDNKLLFRADDPTTDEPHRVYYAYDIADGEIQVIDSDHLFEEISHSADQNRSSRYTFTNYSSLFRRTVEITDKTTGETKTIDKSVLKSCEEGKQILKLGLNGVSPPGCIAAYERNGEIYLLFLYLVDGAWGYPTYLYMMKYDFDSHTAEYHSSAFFETYPWHIFDFYIP